MTAATPGQVAFEAREALRVAIVKRVGCTAPNGPCETCGRIVSGYMDLADIYAKAADDAQDARPAPADGITPEYAAYEAYAMGAPDDLEFAEWEHVPAWQKRAIASAVQAGYEQRARQEARPAPGPLALQLIIAVDALRDIADEPHPGYGPERAAKALDDIGTPGFAPPKPAPELAAAMRKSRRYLEALQIARSFLLDPESSGRRRAIAAISKALEGK